MSPPVGPTGIAHCSGETPEEPPPKLRVGANYGYFWSDLSFGQEDATIGKRAVTATLDYKAGERLTLQAGGGSVLSGDLEVRGTRYRFLPGWVAAAAASYALVRPKPGAPFVMLSGTLALSDARTEEVRAAPPPSASFFAFDARVGVTAGITVLDALSPYATVRAFGGPIAWSLAGRDVTGTDKYHVQIGAGLVAAATRWLDVYAELVPLGERAVSVGVGASL